MPMFWAANVFESTEFIIAVGLLISVLLGGAVVISLTDLWRKKRKPGEAGDAAETLSMYREMNRRGEISDDEYKAIRVRLANRMKLEAGEPAIGASTAGYDDLKVAPPASDSAESKNE